jgi:hypothetical protein
MMKHNADTMTHPYTTSLWRGLLLGLMSLCLFATASVLVVHKTQAAVQLPLPVTILQFGALPTDGRDDTDAMQLAADYLSTHPGTTLIYPPGVYNITRTVDLEHEFSPDFRDKGVVYSNCHGVSILGVNRSAAAAPQGSCFSSCLRLSAHLFVLMPLSVCLLMGVIKSET